VKLIVAEPVKKFSVFYETLRFITDFRSAHLRPCVTLRKTLIFLRRGVVSFPPNPQVKRPTPCRLSASGYSIYSEPLSISGGRPLHPKLENARHAVVKRDPW
jgi:hypothetical protein